MSNETRAGIHSFGSLDSMCCFHGGGSPAVQWAVGFSYLYVGEKSQMARPF